MIKNIIGAVVSFATLASAEKVPPPTDGKFFYTNMRSGGMDVSLDIHGTHRIDTLVSDGNQVLPLAINTQDPYFTVYSNQCDLNTCDANKKYNSGNSTTKNSTSLTLDFPGYVFETIGETLDQVNFLAKGTGEQIKFQLKYGE